MNNISWRPIADVREQLLLSPAMYLRADEYGIVRARTLSGMGSSYLTVLCIDGAPLVLPGYGGVDE